MMGAYTALDTAGAKQTFPKVDQPPFLFYNEERWMGWFWSLERTQALPTNSLAD